MINNSGGVYQESPSFLCGDHLDKPKSSIFKELDLPSTSSQENKCSKQRGWGRGWTREGRGKRRQEETGNIFHWTGTGLEPLSWCINPYSQGVPSTHHINLYLKLSDQTINTTNKVNLLTKAEGSSTVQSQGKGPQWRFTHFHISLRYLLPCKCILNREGSSPRFPLDPHFQYIVYWFDYYKSICLGHKWSCCNPLVCDKDKKSCFDIRMKVCQDVIIPLFSLIGTQ